MAACARSTWRWRHAPPRGYFPSVRIGRHVYSDGGLFAVASDQVALHELEHFMGVDPGRVSMLSIGSTTAHYRPAEAVRDDTGAVGWLSDGRLVLTLIAMQQQHVQAMMEHRLGRSLSAARRRLASRRGSGHRRRHAAGHGHAERAGAQDASGRRPAAARRIPRVSGHDHGAGLSRRPIAARRSDPLAGAWTASAWWP